MADNFIVLYRIIRADAPTIDDMRSYAELGIPLRHDTPAARWRASGLSVFDSLEQARRIGTGPPWHGSGFIAELRVPNDAPVKIERTGRQRGHYTLWGSPDVILGYSALVGPIRSEEEAG